MTFADRRQAGEALGHAVAGMSPTAPLVAALPRGGVPVAFEVADALDCPLDVLVVRKVGVPRQPELAMGAVSESDVVVRNEEVISLVGITDSEFAAAAAAANRELDQRLAEYRDTVPAVDMSGRTVIVVDDGLATGSTAEAAISVVKASDAAAVWLAVPVAPRDTVRRMKDLVDELVVLETPRRFLAVGAWYIDFRQTTTKEVLDLLARARG